MGIVDDIIKLARGGGSPQQLGDIAASVGKVVVRTAISQVLTNAAMLDHIARRMYENETRQGWQDAPVGRRALFTERARTSVAALLELVLKQGT